MATAAISFDVTTLGAILCRVHGGFGGMAFAPFCLPVLAVYVHHVELGICFILNYWKSGLYIWRVFIAFITVTLLNSAIVNQLTWSSVDFAFEGGRFASSFFDISLNIFFSVLVLVVLFLAVNYDRNHIFTDGDISRRLLNRSHLTLVKNINEHDIDMTFREMEGTGLLSST